MLTMSCSCGLRLERTCAVLLSRPSLKVISRFSFPNSLHNLKLKRKQSSWHFAKSLRANVNGHGDGDLSQRPNPSNNGSPPQEAVLKVISEVSKTEGRVAQTLNVVMGGTVTGDSKDEWKVLDQQVNSYPTVRGFIAIGTGGEDFVQAMVGAVESVLQCPIPEDRVRHRLSSQGKYVSVNIGPVTVVSSDQVQEVYKAMRRDVRMKYFL